MVLHLPHKGLLVSLALERPDPAREAQRFSRPKVPGIAAEDMIGIDPVQDVLREMRSP